MAEPRWRLSELTRVISSLRGFDYHDPDMEQVPTPAREAGRLLWEAYLRGDIQERKVVDLGCGTGSLSIGAALLGAGSVTGIDGDPDAIGIARENAREAGVEVGWIEANIPMAQSLSADTVLMNPPFGVQRRNAVKPFIDASFSAVRRGGAVYFFSGPGSQRFIERAAIAQGITVEEHERSVWPFPPVFSHHRKRLGKVTVDRWILRKEKS